MSWYRWEMSTSWKDRMNILSWDNPHDGNANEQWIFKKHCRLNARNIQKQCARYSLQQCDDDDDVDGQNRGPTDYCHPQLWQGLDILQWHMLTLDGENCIMRSFMMCVPHQILFAGPNEGWWDGQGMWHISREDICLQGYGGGIWR